MPRDVARAKDARSISPLLSVMAEELILNNFRTAYHILHRNVVRTLRTQTGVDTRLDLQATQATRLFLAAEPVCRLSDAGLTY